VPAAASTHPACSTTIAVAHACAVIPPCQVTNSWASTHPLIRAQAVVAACRVPAKKCYRACDSRPGCWLPPIALRLRALSTCAHQHEACRAVGAPALAASVGMRVASTDNTTEASWNEWSLSGVQQGLIHGCHCTLSTSSRCPNPPTHAGRTALLPPLVNWPAPGAYGPLQPAPAYQFHPQRMHIAASPPAPFGARL